jgi:serine/threonine protein kinase
MNHAIDNFLFEKFEILECLKKDQHSSVYIANHVYLGKQIFLKTLDTRNLPDQSILSRFKREAKILARLDHPNIIKVLDFGTYQHHFYISFEYFESRHLREVIKNDHLDVAQKVDLTRQFLEGLAFAHEHRIIHRDIKPENILIDDRYRLKIADFGLAVMLNEDHVTQKSTVVGTAGYMSPEQIGGSELSIQSDIFSAGIVIYELFSGKNPFIGKDLGETINNILKIDIQQSLQHDADFPEEILSILKRMLVRDRSKRTFTVQEILERLITDPMPVARKSGNDSGRKSIPRWVLLSSLILLIWIGGLIILNYRNAKHNDKRAMSDIASREKRGTETANEMTDGIGESQSKGKVDSSSINSNANLQASAIQLKDTNESELPNSIDRNLRTESSHEENKAEVHSNNMEQASPRPVTTAALPGRLFIRTQPSANIFIDSIPFGETPPEKPFEFSPGERQLTLVNANFPEYHMTVKIQSGETINFSADLDTLFGYLECQVYPWGEITIDGNSKGQTPLLHPIILTPGGHALTIKNPQFREFETKIEIARKDTLRYQLNFENLAEK